MHLRPILTLLLITFGSHLAAQLVIELKDTVRAGAIGRVADRMIVAFDELAPIGVMDQQSGPLNVFLEGSVGQSLMKVLDRSMTTQGPDREVVLKLGQLRLLQVAGSIQLGMHMEFLEPTPTGHARLFDHGVSLTHSSAGKKDVSRLIGQAFQECLDAFAKHDAEGMGMRTELDSMLTHSAIVRRTNELPVWHNSLRPAGVYRTFNDMRLDRPDTIGFAMREKLRSLYDDQLVKLRQVDRDTRNGIWGFTDGEHIYKNLGGEFIRLERYEETFRAHWNAPTQTDASAVVIGGLLGGLAGALLADGITREPGPIIQYELDPLSGELWPVKELGERPVYKSVHLFYYSRFAKHNTDVHVELSGRKVVTLNKRNWTVLSPEPRIAHTSATVSVKGGSTVTVDIDSNSIRTEVYLIDVKADGSLSAKRLSMEMAHKVLEGIKDEDRR